MMGIMSVRFFVVMTWSASFVAHWSWGLNAIPMPTA